MDFNSILKDRGLKITKARVAILNIFEKSEESIDAERILLKCKKNSVDINLSTVYRTLELFEEKGLIDRFSTLDGKFTYKLKGEEHNHVLQCDLCNKEVSVPCPIRHYEELVENETGFILTDHNLVMRGVCNDCKKDKS